MSSKLNHKLDSGANTPSFGLDQTVEMVCEKCGKNLFQQGFQMRKVPAILTGTGQPGLIPITVFYCESCKHVNSEFLPEELKKALN